jgi:hypothetical protein
MRGKNTAAVATTSGMDEAVVACLMTQNIWEGYVVIQPPTK